MEEQKQAEEKLEVKKNIKYFFWLFKIIRSYKIEIVLGIVFMLIFSIFNTLPAIVIKDMVDALAANKQIKIEVFFWVGIGIVALYVLKGISYFGQNYLMNLLGQKLMRDIRQRMFEKMIYLPLSYFHKMTSGKLINRFTSDLTVIDQAVFVAITGPLRDIPQIIILMGLLIVRSWQLFLVIIFVIPIAAWLINYFSNRNLNITSSKVYQFDGLINTIMEVINGIRVVKSNTMEKQETAKLINANNNVFRFAKKGILINSYSMPLIETIGAICGSITLVYGAYLIKYDFITGGDLASFIVAFFMLNNPIKKLNGFSVKIIDATVSSRRVFELLNEKNPIIENQKTTKLPPFNSEINVNINRFSYKDITVLKNINLKIPYNVTIAIVGATGSGKSTLVNLLPRFFDLTKEEGQITIDGYDIRDIELNSLRSQIAIVTQDMFLFNDTIKFNITCGADKTDEEIANAAKNAYADEFIDHLPDKYEQNVGETGFTLSGGEKQRISIARALIKNAPILILDEATSHLDNQSEQIVQRAIDNLIDKRTTIIIAHRLSTVKKADIIYFMKDGEVIDSGTHLELLDRDSEYKKLYNIQFRD